MPTQHETVAGDVRQVLTPHGVAQLQRRAGNRATSHLIMLQLQPLPGRTKRRRLAQQEELAEMDRVNAEWEVGRYERHEHEDTLSPTPNPFAELDPAIAGERTRLAAKRERLLNRPKALPRDPRTFVVGTEASAAQDTIKNDTVDLQEELTAAYDDAVANAPDRAAELAALRETTATRIDEAQHNLATRLSVGHDKSTLAQVAPQLLSEFREAAATEVSKSRWERQAAFLSGDHPEARQVALTAAVHDVTLAQQFLDEVYAHVGYDQAKIAAIRAAGFEPHGVVLAAALGANWPAFITVTSTRAERLPFVVAHLADWSAAANPADALVVWHANPVALATLADVQTLLGLPLVNGSASTAVKLAKLLGSVSVPDLASLAALGVSGLTANEIVTLAVIGGDLPTVKALRAAGVTPDQCRTFNAKTGPAPAQIAAAWATIVGGAADVQQQKEFVVALVNAPNASIAHLQALIQNFGSFASRTTISSTTVARNVELGLLIPKKTSYPTNSGPGSAWKFLLGPGGRRIAAEWHVHYYFGKKTSVVGTTWKDGANRFQQGLKRVPAPRNLLAAIKTAAKWTPGS